MGHGSSPWLVACCGARCRRLQCGRRRRRCRRSWSGSAARASACATQRTCNERARSAQGGPRPCGQVAALEVLAETSGPEVDSLRSALEWNKIVIRVCGGSPDHRVQGVHRTGTKRRADLDAQRALEVASLEEPGCNVWRQKCRGRPRLWRTPPRNQTARIWAAELEQLHRKMNELPIQNLELQGSCKRQAVGISTP